MDETDRILSEDEAIQPSLGFSARVMRAVRDEAEQTKPLAFPWRRLLPGLCVCAVLILAAAVGWVPEPASSLSDPALPTLAIEGVSWVAATLLGSGWLVWWVLRPSRPRGGGF